MTATDPDAASSTPAGVQVRDPVKDFYAGIGTGARNVDRLELFVRAYREHRDRLGRPVSVLDVACGRKAYLSTRVVDGDDYWAVDIVAPQVPVQHFVQVDLNTLEGAAGLAGRTFDIIFCGELIEHLFSPDDFLEWLKTVMNEDSLLILSTPNLAYWANRVLLPLGIMPLFLENSSRKRLGRRFRFLGQGKTVEGHIRVFTHRAMLELLAEQRFNITRVISVPVWNLPLDRLFSRLSPHFGADTIYLLTRP